MNFLFRVENREDEEATSFCFTYYKYDEKWLVRVRDEKLQIDLFGGFYGWPPIGEGEKEPMGGDIVYEVEVDPGNSPTVFKIIKGDQPNKWSIWQKDVAKDLDLICEPKIWPVP